MAKNKRKYNSDVIDIEGIFEGTDQDQGPEVDLFDTTSIGEAIKRQRSRPEEKKADNSKKIKVKEVGKDGKTKKPSFSWDKPWGFSDEPKEREFKIDPAVEKKAREIGKKSTSPKKKKVKIKKSSKKDSGSNLTPTQVMEGRAAARKLEREGKVAPISDKVMNKAFKDSVEAEKKRKPKFSETRKRSRSAEEESLNADIEYDKDMDNIDAEFKKLKMQR